MPIRHALFRKRNRLRSQKLKKSAQKTKVRNLKNRYKTLSKIKQSNRKKKLKVNLLKKMVDKITTRKKENKMQQLLSVAAQK